MLSWRRETEVAAAQQILAELVEGVLSRLVLSHMSQTPRSCDSCVELLVKQCVELYTAVLSAVLYIFYSPAAPPIEPDSTSDSTVFGTVLYCKAAQDMTSFGRDGFRQLAKV